MLARARARGRDVTLLEGDAMDPPVEPSSFDAVVLNLILSVVPDGAACLRAALRALRPGGRAVVFDKFLRDGAAPGVARRLLNLGATTLGTDINRRFADLAEGSGALVIHDEPSLFGGAYRVLLLGRA
jgi:SAM-dependent methyltransferase